MNQRTVIILSRNGRFSNELKTGAVERTVADIVRSSSYRDQIEVFGREQTDDQGQSVSTFPGVRYRAISVPKGCTKSIWHKAVRVSLAQDIPATIIVQQSPSTAWFLKRMFPQCRVVLQRHDAQPLSSILKRWSQDYCMRRADLILANSKFTQDHHVKNRGQNAKRVKLLYVPASIPSKSDIAQKQNLVTCVAAMVPKKGAHLFAEAMAVLTLRYPDWNFVFISETGGKAPEKYRDKIWGILRNLPDNAHHHGFLPYDSVLDFFRKSKIAVVPSQCVESFGRTAAEAAAHGCALVHSNRGGLPEVAGPDGLIVEGTSATDYAAAIEILMNDSEEQVRRGASSRQHAIDTYSAAKVGERFDTLVFGNSTTEAPNK